MSCDINKTKYSWEGIRGVEGVMQPRYEGILTPVSTDHADDEEADTSDLAPGEAV